MPLSINNHLVVASSLPQAHCASFSEMNPKRIRCGSNKRMLLNLKKKNVMSHMTTQLWTLCSMFPVHIEENNNYRGKKAFRKRSQHRPTAERRNVSSLNFLGADSAKSYMLSEGYTRSKWALIEHLSNSIFIYNVSMQKMACVYGYTVRQARIQAFHKALTAPL